MFGRKAARIKVLEEVVNNHELNREESIKRRYTLMNNIAKLEMKNQELKKRVDELEKELSLIKPVFETPGFKPAMTARCGNCGFAYFSEYDGTLLGCAKDVVCDDYVPLGVKKEK